MSSGEFRELEPTAYVDLQTLAAAVAEAKEKAVEFLQAEINELVLAQNALHWEDPTVAEMRRAALHLARVMRKVAAL